MKLFRPDKRGTEIISWRNTLVKTVKKCLLMHISGLTGSLALKFSMNMTNKQGLVSGS